MCKSKADGGKRCDCPREYRNARQRALYAAQRAARLAGEPESDDTAPQPIADPSVGTKPIARVDVSSALKDLQHALVGDDADPEKTLNFFASIEAAEVEARARGLATSHRWSPLIRARLFAEAERRGAQVVDSWGDTAEWKARGRVLREGAEEHPYTIFKPVFGRGGTKHPDHFVEAPVFNWTQTRPADGSEDPDWAPSIPGGSQALLERLAASSKYPVTFDGSRSYTGIAHGWTDRDQRRIVIDATRSVGTQFATLAHEMAHVILGHDGIVDQAKSEAEAQMTGYFVVRALRLGAGADDAVARWAGNYVRNWVRTTLHIPEHAARWKMLQDQVQRAQDAADRILAGLFGLPPDPAR